MAGYRACGGGNATTVLQAAFIVILLTIPNVSGAQCRFASTATSQGSCIFPCRCTKDCNTTTGECINSGTCNDGSPRGYRWSGTACQIGNVAYNKTASQENYARGNLFPARMAVDGRIDQWKFPERCALPNHGQDSDAWWQVDLGEVYKISRVEIYSGNSKCTTGHFGAHCQFQCSCRSGETCNEITGKCPSDCPSGRWGVGCMLNNDNYYNDPKGKKYLGKRSHATHRANGVPFTGACRPWTEQTLHPDKKFLDGSRKAAKNFCRNTDNSVNTWCFFDTSNKKRPTWAHCKLSNKRCVAGRFDANCDQECHCSSATDNCQLKNGRCDNGCAPHFEGLTCQENRLPSTFTVSVGKSSDRTGHKQCASHSGQAVNGAVVNKTCTAIGRYVSFQRNKGGEPRLTALCEVVVIGHRYISCDNCSSACNNIIGCEACPPGKQQPDCKTDCVKGYYGINCGESCGKCKDISKCSIINGDCGGVCETGYYGVNCNKTCGKCKHNSACDIKNGVCGSGCETWFAPSNCTIYIEKATFESSDKPVVADITKSSVTLSWPKARDMTPNLGGTYYVYIVRLIADGEAYKNVRQVAQDSDKSLITSQFTGLRYNKNYEVRVQPYREHNGEQDGGTATGVTKFKTNCKAPVIEHLTTSTPDWPTNTSTIVSWKAIHENGCDEITSIRLSYQRHAQNETWKDVDIEHVDQTKVTITDLSYYVYDVKLIATNNKNLSASIEIVITNLLTTTTPLQTTTPSSGSFNCGAAVTKKCESSAVLGTGAWVGVAFGTLILGMVIMAVIMLNIERMRNCSSKTDNQRQDTEMSPTQNTEEIVEDAQGYVVTSRGPNEQEEFIEDASDYVKIQRDSSQPEDRNQYAVIQT